MKDATSNLNRRITNVGHRNKVGEKRNSLANTLDTEGDHEEPEEQSEATSELSDSSELTASSGPDSLMNPDRITRSGLDELEWDDEERRPTKEDDPNEERKLTRTVWTQTVWTLMNTDEH